MEVWKPVTGFEGLYEVSDLGRVRSLSRVVEVNSTKHPAHRRTLCGRILKPTALAVGYHMVHLQHGNPKSVHGIVAEAFLGPRPEGLFVCHENGDHGDNRLVNLRYDTPRNNSRDMRRHGTAVFGERHKSAKVTEANVLSIRARVGRERLTALASEFGVSVQQIRNIADRVSWTHI